MNGNTISILDAPFREFKTRKAAEKLLKREFYSGGQKATPKLIVSETSAYDIYWPKGKKCYQIFVD